MNKVKSTTKYHIQASLDGGPWNDAVTKEFRSLKSAEKYYDRILRECYPTWRGLNILWRIMKRKITIENEIAVFSCPSHGTKRSLLGELIVPSWLSKREKEKFKMRRIPDAEERWQPTSQLPAFPQEPEF
jgi:hypothetical protein